MSGRDTRPANCFSDFRCYEPQIQGGTYRTQGNCDLTAGPCTVEIAVPVRFPGLLDMIDSEGVGGSSTPLVYWFDEASPGTCGGGTITPQCNPSEDEVCGLSVAGGRLIHDNLETVVEQAVSSCAALALSTEVYSLRAIACRTACRVDDTAGGWSLGSPAAAEALGCAPPPEPPTYECTDCSCKPGGANPGGGGGSAGPGLGTGGASDFGPGTHLRYRAGGAGHPGLPGSAAWRQRLGLYWSHGFAQRLVEDPDESHVWLITEHATFREFSSPDGAGVYQTVSPSNEYRTLTWLDPGWTLRELDGTLHAFDGTGRWLSTTDRHGNARTACYDSEPSCDGSGPLIAVDLPDGRRETFTYGASGKLETITEVGVGGTESRTWTLRWFADGFGDTLIEIGRPDGAVLELAYQVPGRPGYLSRLDLADGPPSGPILPQRRVVRAWEYDDHGNVVKTWRGDRSFDGPQAIERWQLAFDDPVLPTVTTVTDPLGEVETYTLGRDSVSSAPRIEALSGACPLCSLSGDATIQYGSAHPLLPETVTDGEGHVTVSGYDAFGQRTSRTEAVDDVDLTRTTAWTYHPTFHTLVTRIERPSTDGVGLRVTDFTYDPANGDLLDRTDSGSEATYPSGSFSRVTTYPDYNAAGQVETVDPPGYGTSDRTTFTYDPARGDLLMASRQEPLLAAPTTYTYDAFNRSATVTDPNGLVTERLYDAMDRLRFVIERSAGSLPGTPTVAADLVTESIYNGFGDLVLTILPRGNRLAYGYDGAGRLVSIERQTAAGVPVERSFFTLDGAGNRTREEQQLWTGFAWQTETATEHTYETRCRRAATTVAPGVVGEEATTQYDYDCNGNLTEVWDPRRDPLVDPPSQEHEYDALDRLERMTQPWGGAGGGEVVTDYEYDVQDHLTAVVDGEGTRTTFEYSDRDLMTAEVSLVSGTTTYTYNDHGELISSLDARGVETVRVVDALDRVTQVTYVVPDPPESPSDDPDFLVDPSPQTTYLYDVAPSACGAEEDFAIGRLASITRHGESLDFCHDRFGRLTRDGELTYGHDDNGNRSTIGYPAGVTATYTYDAVDRQESLTVDDGLSPSQAIVTSAAYRAGGPLDVLGLGNGLTEVREANDRYDPESLAVGSLLAWTYTTDLVGNLSAITDPALGDRTFTYQAPQDFLTSASGPWGALAWTYDRIGNRLSEDRDSTADSYAYTPNGCALPDRPCPGNTALLETVTLGAGGARGYAFGAAGHLEGVTVGSNAVVLDSDGEGRLSSLRRPAATKAAEMLYDGRSYLSRAAEIPAKNDIFRDGFETGDTGCWSAQVGGAGGPGGAGCFSLEGRRVRPLYDSQGTVHAFRVRPDSASAEETHHVFYLAGRPVSQRDGATATWTFLTTDHLGTPILATDLAGNLVWRGGFEPYGRDWQAGTPAGASENGVFLRLPGQWDDPAWGDASEGVGVYYNVHRWYQPQVSRFSRNDPLSLLAGMNLSVYSRSNPLGLKDPVGLLPKPPSGEWCDEQPPELPICQCDPETLGRELKGIQALRSDFCDGEGLSHRSRSEDPVASGEFGVGGGVEGGPQDRSWYDPSVIGDDPCVAACVCAHEENHRRMINDPRVEILIRKGLPREEILDYLECIAYGDQARCLEKVINVM